MQRLMKTASVTFLFAMLILVPAVTQALETGSSFVLPVFSQTVSLDFKDANLKDVLKVFSQQIGVNFLLNKNVEDKTITVYLENVPVEEALEMILSAHDLTYDLNDTNNTIIVKTRVKAEDELATRIYQLRYASVSASKVRGMLTVVAGGGGGEGEGGGDSGGGGASVAAAGISDAVKMILTDKGKVSDDTRTNSLVVTDKAGNFQAIEKLIARLDVPIPQVLIEVEMLDVNKSLLDEMGVTFSGNILTVSSSDLTFSPSDGHYRRYDNIFDFYKKGNVQAGLEAILQFLKTQSDTKNLARPRLLTVDNETAQIKISTNEAIGVKTSTTGSDATAETTKEAERENTGVYFTVTPQVNLVSQEITLAVNPRVIDATSESLFEGGTIRFKNPEERSISAILKVKNGQTVVIGGLLRVTAKRTETKIPILGDIPLLGMAFRSKVVDTAERELLIVLTPRILGISEIPLGQMDPAYQTSKGQVNQVTSEDIDREMDRYLESRE